MVVNAQFNNIPSTALIDTTAMLTLVNRKYVGNRNVDNETVELRAQEDILYQGLSLLPDIMHWLIIIFLGLLCCSHG